MARRRRGSSALAWIAAAAAVLAMGVALGLAAAAGLVRWGAEAPPPVPARPPVGPRTLPAAPPGAPAPRTVPERTPAPPVGRAAIIFDDAGGSLEDLEQIIALGRPVTVAVLPGLRFSREVAERARAAGLEVFLHLPLEPEDPTKTLGPGGITTAMSEAEIERAVRAGLDAVPQAVGVNNHMGSKGTADPRVMRAVLRVVRERNLRFVDSVTSPRSVAAAMAAEMGIPVASRQVFLDNENDPAAIRAQLRRLIRLARTTGEAVAIGHAQRVTAQVLREMLGEFDTAGIELVPASALAR
ncbi:MAG: divergent polysaccharide deacetylase family protein [Armatimonadota bacterium]|nr:divergent polysaccharide deacetylase family protein [Armatimonadota bacterium]MDR7452397.1 divergent polysaccharide deacetylase family protein [Armatimonadota bacterium]MDR7466742.1 divergent polysaccharide deacetylase family protein [Armatimonadota bacterium]MDR7492784.1 divergent polysaccharide deacetylase family protein [Armatimonadota bacterium]MDR7498560.1 divergent polysaccharide deacetylase family protein [Armatimonadota bacterium]